MQDGGGSAVVVLVLGQERGPPNGARVRQDCPPRSRCGGDPVAGAQFDQAKSGLTGSLQGPAASAHWSKRSPKTAIRIREVSGFSNIDSWAASHFNMSVSTVLTVLGSQTSPGVQTPDIPVPVYGKRRGWRRWCSAGQSVCFLDRSPRPTRSSASSRRGPGSSLVCPSGRSSTTGSLGVPKSSYSYTPRKRKSVERLARQADIPVLCVRDPDEVRARELLGPLPTRTGDVRGTCTTTNGQKGEQTERGDDVEMVHGVNEPIDHAQHR